MSIVAEKILSEVKTLSAEDMRHLLHDIEQILEDMEDISDAERIRDQILRGETTTHAWHEVLKEAGVSEHDLDS